jgi:hypothetical protein
VCTMFSLVAGAADANAAVLVTDNL